MLLSHNWLKSYYTNPETMPEPKKVAELFTMRAFEVEGIEEKGDDTIYDIKVTPDRAPYAYGMRFVALELSLLVPELVMLPEILKFSQTNIDLSNIANVVDATLIDENAQHWCPMYSLTKIENVQNGPAPEWLKIRLESIGQQSRGLIVDLTNFVMFDTGQPLHAFDADKIEGKIHVGRSREGEKITILGGKEILLTMGTLVIRDDKDILAIAGVKGGVKAEVGAGTKNIYLESANFDQVIVRKMARSLNLLNDSSKRFEQGLTPERFLSARKTYLYFLSKEQSEVSVSDVVVSSDISVIADESKLRMITVDIPTTAISINKEDSRVPGLLKEFLENILPKTGAKVEKADENTYKVTQPHYRADLVSQADVVDEFLRNKGYDFLTYTEPVKNKVEGLADPMDKLSAMIRNYFIGIGYDEVKLHTLVDSKENPTATKLANALTSERDSLRADLSTNMSIALEQNLRHLDLVGKKVVQLFEIAKVFTDKKDDVEEKTHLAFGIAVVKWPKGESAESEIKGYVTEMATELGLPESVFKVTAKNNIGVVEVDMEEVIKIIDTEKLDEAIKSICCAAPINAQYKKASIYPAMSRDIAFFGSQNQEEVSVFIKGQVERCPLIENYFCFDIFSKDDKTSYAYRFVFQSYEKTLTEEEVSVYMNEIAEAVKGQGWIVR
ncbi:MAG: hypothetical protein RJB39_99 [Candidatus Parcubacteria bacterium]|jgi:phenylalanyl-tRNA synthetase beta chain